MEKICEMIRAKTPVERLKMGCSMYQTSKSLVISAILEDDPNISQAHLRRELFLKFYSNDFDAITRDKIVKHLENHAL